MILGDNMYYMINSLFMYSFLGFCMESCIYKIMKSKRHSGIFYGPITEVYGFGILFLILFKKYFLDKIHGKWYFKLLLTFFSCTIILTLVEWLGGSILYHFFNIKMWDYSKKTFHIGKFICLELAFIWGLLGTCYIYFIKNFIDKFIELIPKKLTITLMIINMIDTIFVLINKIL